MSITDALAKSRASRPKPSLVAIAVGNELFNVEVRRLDGMEWAGVMAECPPVAEKDTYIGYDTNKAALVACRGYGRLLNMAGEPQDMAVKHDEAGTVISDRWAEVFTEISGDEIGHIAAGWWGKNVSDPNKRVEALKKAFAGGKLTSSN